ncbi:protein GLUTAMINE DUMPER 5-like [Humulus lupulus]|uniref:protein GLUTAMINE DUMPER 5-like n=1 Tax=Humulus lupulus TaxID=3486 RepID=UPI002B40F64C|nr:protein GLUTAMINE DUMPER 5-like [Humulus lupulus]
MRPPTNSTATSGGGAVDGGFRHWNSPIPYLFGGLAIMLGLITVALIILACSYRKSPSSSSAVAAEAAASSSAVVDVGGGNEDHQKTTTEIDEVVVDCDQPKFVVIMAGDHNPTFLANPVVYSTCHTLPINS